MRTRYPCMRAALVAGALAAMAASTDEVFVVLEGALTVRVRDDVHEVAAGGTAFNRGATPHTFTNTSSVPARFLVVGTPGGFHEYFRALAAGDDERLAAVAERFLYEPVEGA